MGAETLWLYHNWGADRDEAQQILCIPVCQAETAVRLRAANVFRAGGAMDAIAWLVESDPDGAHRIVRTGLQD